MKTPIHRPDTKPSITDEFLRIATAKSAEAYVEALIKDFESTTPPEG